MYRKRRKIQSYYGTSRGIFGSRFKFLVLAVIALAVVSVLISGAVFGKNAEKSKRERFGRKNLSDFGGAEQTAEDYASLGTVKGGFAESDGVTASEFRQNVKNAYDGNAVVFFANTADGKVLFDTESTEQGTTASINASDIADAINDQKKLGVAGLYVSSFDEESNAKRVMKAATEQAIAAELAEAGIDEIILLDIPDDSDKGLAVSSYLANVEAVCGKSNVCIAVSKSQAEGSGVSRLVTYAEGYADAFVLDLRGLDAEGAAMIVEKSAYFITNYNMRLMFSNADEEANSELEALANSYGIESCLFVK